MKMMKKRKIRVQIAIVKDNQLLLLHHIMPEYNKAFWGMPGGGVEEGESERQAAVREARQETCLDIELEDFRYAYETENNLFYDRVVTFIGYPVSGEANVGYDPEEGMHEVVRLTAIKWHPLYDDSGLEEVAKRDLTPVRLYFDEKTKTENESAKSPI